jgi:hypothetical protein
MRYWKECLAAIAVVSIVIYSTFTLMSYLEFKNQERWAEERLLIVEGGRSSLEAGVPANANPHIDRPSDATAWLEGWAEASREQKDGER